MACLVAQLVKNLPTVQETQVWFPGREYPVEKEVATHSSILAWRIPWRGVWRARVHGVARVGHNLATKPPLPASQAAVRFSSFPHLLTFSSVEQWQYHLEDARRFYKQTSQTVMIHTNCDDKPCDTNRRPSHHVLHQWTQSDPSRSLSVFFLFLSLSLSPLLFASFSFFLPFSLIIPSFLYSVFLEDRVIFLSLVFLTCIIRGQMWLFMFFLHFQFQLRSPKPENSRC